VTLGQELEVPLALKPDEGGSLERGRVLGPEENPLLKNRSVTSENFGLLLTLSHALGSALLLVATKTSTGGVICTTIPMITYQHNG
jgi:hypothetical protein